MTFALSLVSQKVFTALCVVQESSEIDCTMPADLRLERKAFTKPIGFAQVAKRQDEIAMQDDVKRAENKALFIARTRQLLDGQMKELSAQRVSLYRLLVSTGFWLRTSRSSSLNLH